MKAIATVGVDIPRDLLNASGVWTGHLPWDADRPTPRADEWLESSFAPWSKSILEDWAAGAFDHLDAVVFTRGDDSAQRLYYYVCELQARGLIAGPKPLIFDVARIGRATSVARTILAVRRLAAQLGIDDAALERGIAAANCDRDAGPVPSTENAVLLAGTPPPDDRLHRVIRSCGFAALGETLADMIAQCGPPVAEASGDPAAAIGRQVHDFGQGPRSFVDRTAALVAAAQAARVRAVILWVIEEEEALVWGIPAQRAALAAAGIPALVLTRRRWDAADGAAADISAFLKGIGS